MELKHLMITRKGAKSPKEECLVSNREVTVIKVLNSETSIKLEMPFKGYTYLTGTGVDQQAHQFTWRPILAHP